MDHHSLFLDIIINKIHFYKRTPGKEKIKEVPSQTNDAERKKQKTISLAKLLTYLRPNLRILTYQ